MMKGFALLALLAVNAQANAQWLDLRTPGIPRNADGSVDPDAAAPRTPEGRPDIAGLWVPTAVTGSLLNPQNIQPWARDAMAASTANFHSEDPRFHCLPSGPGSYPAGAAYGGQRRIVQSPNFIAVLNSDLTYRQIFLDGRELEADPFPTWMGYSAARWDGDTLVVESNGYNDRTWLHRDGLPHTEALRIVERYRRSSFGQMQIEISYDDPGTFLNPVQALVEMRFAADSELLEVVCNESSKGATHYSGELSEAEEKVVTVDPEVLERYVGTYQGRWLGNLITAEVTLEDGVLHLERTPPYSDSETAPSIRSALIAQSQNAFECACGLGFIFTGGEEGPAQRILEVHVSGAWTFERVQ